ncbi:hypothetical protein KUCAC02_001047 [Chaenocephalus aceratus]|uniref:Uncharacterized protein n=1 Tax=Chaenocephalus aceratus TaxID=36190 RepID=A0ACB9XWS6_CHAAC|nr:hypothetical protein KUCAC02_001047 [Chaenocephalus aceratus]
MSWPILYAQLSVWGDEHLTSPATHYSPALLFVSTPPLLVTMYVAYRNQRDRKRLLEGSAGALWWTYAFSLLFRLLFEGGFMYALYVVVTNGRVLTWWTASSHAPRRKTIFTVFMATISSICMVLNMAELSYLVAKAVTRSLCGQKERKRRSSRERMHNKTTQKLVSV